MNQKNEEKVKDLILKNIENLKDYAIYYRNSQKNNTTIETINNIENEKKHQDHTYANSSKYCK